MPFFGDLGWRKHGLAVLPLKALRRHITILGSTGSGKTETINRIAYAARAVHNMQVIEIDAKGNTKREEEEGEDNAARFVAAMHEAGATNVFVYPSLHYNGWLGTPTELKNRLLSVVDYNESRYYGDVASNALALALGAQTTPRSSEHFLANLNLGRLKQIYKDNPRQLQRVNKLDKQLLSEVEMRYQVFFDAVGNTLDGTLDFANCDAAYLRVRGFALRDEAPRLGRFLVADFIHYISKRRRPGTLTLFILDEFNALRMGEMASILFEQCRDFGGCLILSSQSYDGLGPREYANRIVDACSTHIIHASSNPFEITKRAGKRWYVDTSYTGDEEGSVRKHTKLRYDWRITEQEVMQQSEGQAFWIYRGHEQQVQTAQILLTKAQIGDALRKIRSLEAMQRQISEAEARSLQQRKLAKEQLALKAKQQTPQSKKQPTTLARSSSGSQTTNPQATWQRVPPLPPSVAAPPAPAPPAEPPYVDPSSLPPVPPLPDLDDDEPDRL